MKKSYIIIATSLIAVFGVSFYIGQRNSPIKAGGFFDETSQSTIGGSTGTTTISNGLVVKTNALVVNQASGNVTVGTITSKASSILTVNGVSAITGGSSGLQFYDRSTDVLNAQLYTNITGRFCVFDHVAAIDVSCWVSGVGFGIGTSTPAASFQAATRTDNATTSLIFGKSGNSTGSANSKGECSTWHDTAGTPVYMYIATGATTFTAQSGGTPPPGCVK